MTGLVAYRSTAVTPDTAEALRQLEIAGAEMGGVRIKYRGVPRSFSDWKSVGQDPGPTGLPAALSMRPTGREVYLGLEFEEALEPLQSLSLLWSIAVPLGFLPWCRYPVPSVSKPDLDLVFHYLGPWAAIGDYLQGGGRGDLAWPSMVAAAQCDVGTWAGSKMTERTIQTHLHRLGVHCGPVDGEMGERTLSSLRALGLGGMTSMDSLEALEKMELSSEQELDERQVGHFLMRGVPVEAFCSGGVEATRTRNGYSIVVEGSGRLILLFGG